MQLLSSILLVAALAAGIVDANPTKTTSSKTSSKDCSKSEFFYESRSCCLPSGGPTATPTPPSGVDCPSSWYYHHGEGCCVPRSKPTPSTTPTCNKKGWLWSIGLQCCSPEPTKPTSPPTPSGKTTSKEKGKKVKRNYEQWDATFCPTGLTTCPIKTSGVLTGDSECVDTTSDVNSCGGCASVGKGSVCAANESCMGGVCIGN